MQAMVVMLIAFGGLGCQNPAGEMPPLPPVAGQPAVNEPALASPVVGQPAAPPPAVSVPAYEPAPTSYAPYYGGGFDTTDPSGQDSFRDCVRDTFCSFFIGRSPDVPSASQIEAAYRAGYYNR
jgi:hypothetical protein